MRAVSVWMTPHRRRINHQVLVTLGKLVVGYELAFRFRTLFYRKSERICSVSLYWYWTGVASLHRCLYLCRWSSQSSVRNFPCYKRQLCAVWNGLCRIVRKVFGKFHTSEYLDGCLDPPRLCLLKQKYFFKTTFTTYTFKF